MQYRVDHVGGSDDFGPVLGFFGDQPSKVGGREREHVITHVGEPRLELGISEAVDLFVELVGDLDRDALRRTDPGPEIGLEVGVRRPARRLRKRALFSKRVREGAKMFLLLSKEQ
jgi:hypothetical protein